VFALRMSNDRDQAIVTSAISDTGSGLLEFLPALGQREAIAFGDGVALPVRIKFDELPKDRLPRLSTAKFSEKWQTSVGDENFLDQVVERWRSAGTGPGLEASQQAAMLADAMGVGPHRGSPPDLVDHHALDAPAYGSARTGHGGPRREMHTPAPAPAAPAPAPRSGGLLRREPAPAAPPAPQPMPAASGDSAAQRMSLRERLLRPSTPR
jgi:hypothetical protein